ncbi:MAG: Do family serine endopeptidase [Hyphomonadaceae bacterium]
MSSTAAITAGQVAASVAGQAGRWGTAPNLADLVEQVSPSVVQIVVRSPNRGSAGVPDAFRGSPFGEFFRRSLPDGNQELPDSFGSGSGFIVDRDGHIVTNNHVVENAKSVTVQFADGREETAEVIGTDPKTDLAVIKINSKNLPAPLAWGDSDNARPGDNVFAMGSPFGLGNTVTAGIVSARGRTTGGSYDDFIQVDAPINRGNSGGPLFNEKGQVIGVNSQILSPSGGNIGIGFSIPSKLAQSIVGQIIKTGTVERGWLGVGIQPVTPEIAKSLGVDTHGAMVFKIDDGGPAAAAGIKEGDIILSFGATKVDTLTDLTIAVAESKPGSTQDVKVLRQGREKTIKVKIKELQDPDAAPKQLASASRGSGSDDATVTLSGLGLDLSNDDGAVVSDVRVNSPAFDEGLRPGDKVLMVNQTPVSSAEAVKKAVDDAARQKREAVLLQVQRGDGNTMFVGVPFSEG